MLELMYGLTNDNRFIRVDLIYYPKPPTSLYIHPKEGWHLLARSGRLDYKGQAFQDASFQRAFVALEEREAFNILNNSFSRVEKMYHKMMSDLLKENKGYLKIKTTINFKKEREHERKVLRIGY